ncbi:MAG: CinA family protein [Pseudomonadota bacterium]
MPNLTELSATVGRLLKDQNATIAVTESSTAGLISAALLAVPGASAYYLGGSVVYTLTSRRKLLGIRREDVDGLEPLTEAMTAVFAQKVRAQFEATWSIAELGVAGPTGARYGHPPGISVLAVDGPRSLTAVVDTGSADREENMWTFTRNAMGLLEQALSQ